MMEGWETFLVPATEGIAGLHGDGRVAVQGGGVGDTAGREDGLGAVAGGAGRVGDAGGGSSAGGSAGSAGRALVSGLVVTTLLVVIVVVAHGSLAGGGLGGDGRVMLGGGGSRRANGHVDGLGSGRLGDSNGNGNALAVARAVTTAVATEGTLDRLGGVGGTAGNLTTAGRDISGGGLGRDGDSPGASGGHGGGSGLVIDRRSTAAVATTRDLDGDHLGVGGANSGDEDRARAGGANGHGQGLVMNLGAGGDGCARGGRSRVSRVAARRLDSGGDASDNTVGVVADHGARDLGHVGDRAHNGGDSNDLGDNGGAIVALDGAVGDSRGARGDGVDRGHANSHSGGRTRGGGRISRRNRRSGLGSGGWGRDHGVGAVGRAVVVSQVARVVVRHSSRGNAGEEAESKSGGLHCDGLSVCM
ncbi:hypothetical protein Micbo1qcDRAFT_154976 [Microdochium bolleyi]|uniref:Uncharacterized protein n=1 Tax=Microdochium bolleyi TaxID=196109 RepID=A0A136JGZ0_9PEZI|nr:hypothetical protein Micbo1qcDRAFT_154976 [Microdochium bolleyi]